MKHIIVVEVIGWCEMKKREKDPSPNTQVNYYRDKDNAELFGTLSHRLRLTTIEETLLSENSVNRSRNLKLTLMTCCMCVQVDL